ncbi:hypothetical protein PTSG_06065 [Salpingoeca rosetta]|uniref:Peptidase M20 dimerisation domain-containing protein n=1 Tax=Salpingoeca rosetta (strain ATCC 50818 / BSB-021) TaxID=946362 RepID=F2UDK9_SALR5|nr:uncharacterized protein PTSG_06065 [Salpingoeca rosetta]EGD74704.1 hypothetical protein PTSG_06065 [Salpingoeca rosetta]|eukprot:XP_004992961.1 hypothetical protein PTSG_06065 [Salpingoeca rosetta]
MRTAAEVIKKPWTESPPRRAWTSCIHERIDYIFISNNYWIDDERPCLTYAMRGHIRMVVSVQGPKQNVHAGVDGGAVVEPTIDLCYILGTLVDGAGRVCVPGFYEDVRASSEDDDAAFDRIAFDTTQYRHELGVQRLAQAAERNALRARWAEPTLSITNVQTSNGDQAFSVIPHKATAQVSIRFVPDQKADEIVTVVRHHLEHEFNKRNSGNQLSVEVVQVSQWWRSETSSPYFGAARAATKEVWGCEPLLVCEGGTMHTTCMLVDHFEAPALHLPMGQSSDGAHLPNERIRIQNLVNGQAVVYSFLEHLSKEGTTEEGDEGDRDELVA